MAEPTITDSDRDDVRFSAGKMGINNLSDDEINTALTNSIIEVAERTQISWDDTTNFYQTRLKLWRLMAATSVLKGKNSLVDVRKELRAEIKDLLGEILSKYTEPTKTNMVVTKYKDYQTYPANPRGTRIFGKSRFTKRLGGFLVK